MLRLSILIFLFTLSLFAHTVKPAYLEIKAEKNNIYNIQWKVPIEEEKNTNIIPIFPNTCKKIDKKNSYKVKDNNIIIEYWSIQCQESLMGKTISIANIQTAFTDVLVYYQEDKNSYMERLTATNRVFKIKKESSLIGIIKIYTTLGIKHILLGFDHLLFVLALMLLLTRGKTLIKTITAFTLAHSITLGATILGYIHLQSTFIEAMIALSILILAVETIYKNRGKHGLTTQYPWIVAFMFGLLHGFGFATVLAELGIPKNSLIFSLLFFNIGIEIGQIFFILIIIAIYLMVKKFISNKKLIQGKLFLTYTIGITASYWLTERIYYMFS